MLGPKIDFIPLYRYDKVKFGEIECFRLGSFSDWNTQFKFDGNEIHVAYYFRSFVVNSYQTRDSIQRSSNSPLVHCVNLRKKSTAAVETLAARDSYNVATTITGPNACEEINLTSLGIDGPEIIYHNLTFQELLEHEIANGEGEIAETEYGQTFTVDTGKFTG